MTRSPILRTLAFLVVTVALAGPARAHDANLLDALSAIDIVPTADQLRRVVKTPEVALDAIALDGGLSLYVRERAISLLSAFPTADVARRLEKLSTSAALTPRLRAMAIYTRVRGFAVSGPEAALAYAVTHLRSKDLEARESAIRGLRWIALAGADTALDQALTAETTPSLQATIRHVQRARAAIRDAR